MIGLGIESSCDETSLGLVRDGKEILHLALYSQIESHVKYRGVVPEIASRAHLEKINFLLDECLTQSGLDFSDLAYVAVSQRPGLMGSLMIGAQMARCIHLVHGTPIVCVNHLEAHLSVVRLNIDQLQNSQKIKTIAPFPHLGLLLSGGNSSIYIHKDWNDLELIGDTLDDALGEAFDKAASILGLGYPGGPEIEKFANFYEQEITSGSKKAEIPILPKLLKSQPDHELHFSFSGLKTALLNAKKDHPSISLNRFCFEFQETSIELVLRNVKNAIKKTGIKTVVAGGGVLANTRLTSKLKEFALDNSVEILFPKNKILSTDNGVMVACLGYYLFTKGIQNEIDFQVSPKRIA
ncbi:MAG: tRNA (adenosine(37)-N6)-threonylcarbamoyltransferase complex transferase subunit TsaD [Leptospiraceae bacterium]|nr:tRNA (adenosine(37)-N6)-threonylcarbamoyltransferase complex transferase subunit TsaD [Leptospiraceae bacterium]MCZ8348170.1 tRNA (adenosine(37)-N6)-threonylcarbamoyltransferase complex transferase subunit TsaD [Leptospiraceae bacterium]